MFSIFGFLGQSIYNTADARHSRRMQKVAVDKRPASKWSPVKVLTDEQYDRMLQEKSLSIEAEIATLDEAIAELRNEQRRREEQPPAERE
ncbi:MAG: hypothetical protein M1817_005603 [Caeruleum heppii]|nr:MAG: hypothetical protein M1817_005603 [Caeruleum heppii]